MGRLTDDMTRLVGEIQTAHGERGRLVQELKRFARELQREGAQRRSMTAADLAGARAAWLGSRPRVMPRVGVSVSAVAAERGVEPEPEALRRNAAGKDRRGGTEGRASAKPHEARTITGRHRRG